jgi:hypothetical protein
MQVFSRRYLAATRAVEQKESGSWKRGTEVVDQIRDAGGRAPGLSQRISMAGVVHPAPCPTGMRRIPVGVLMCGVHARTS